MVVVNDQRRFYALSNACTHQDDPLQGGAVSLECIKCERHDSQFELTTGKAKGRPAVKPVAACQTSADAGAFFVLLL